MARAVVIISGTYNFNIWGVGASFQFSVNQSGHIEYDASLSSFLEGAGTSTLIVNGFSINIDATALTVENFYVAYVTDLLNTNELHTITVIPGNYTISIPSTGNFPFTVSSDGSCDPSEIVTPVGIITLRAGQPPTAQAGGPYSVPEGGSVTLTGLGSDPDSDPLTFAWDLDNDGTFEEPGQNVDFSAAGMDGPSSRTVTLQVCDASACDTASAAVNVLNMAPAVGEIAAPVHPVQVNTEIEASADFTDPGVSDIHTAEWDWGDGSTSAGIVDETNGSGSVTGIHTYIAAGVYTVKLTVTDNDGSSGEAVFRYVVVYDPEGGFVTGGGWIDSPEGAYTPDPLLTGKANFGFVSKYKKGTDVPIGETQFRFKAGDLNFHSTSYQWLR